MTLESVPRVAGAPLIGSLLEFRNRRIPLLQRVAREQGDLARMRVGLFEALVVSSPELVQEVLVEKADSFVKSLGLSLFARPLLGNGLVTSEHDFHKRQRKLMAPAFMARRIAGYADVMVERAERAALAIATQPEIDAAEATMQVTLEIVGKTLFDAEVADQASLVGGALGESMQRMLHSITRLVPTPPAVPTPNNIKFKRAVGRLDRVVYQLIEERRREGVDHGDVLSTLLAAQDEDDGSTMSDAQVRDEAMTLLLAGHETTANALAWTLYLLAKHPEVRLRLEAELDRVLQGRAPSYADLKQLPFTLMVLKESMRLYPPVYILGRRAEREVSIAGHAIDKNRVVFINIAGIHRRPDLYPEPERFDPERFAPEREKALPRHGFMPFGGGSRVCIGNHFALMEGQLILASWLRQLRFDLVDADREVEPEPLITLRPKGGLAMRVSRRTALLPVAAE